MSVNPIVSIVIPYIQEFPQIAFTVRAVHTELRGIPHEIVVADNLCPTGILQQWGLGRGTVEHFMALPTADRESLYQQKIAEGGIRPLDKGHRRPKAENVPPFDRQPPRLEPWYAGEIESAESTLESWARKHDWLTYVHYDEKLSHWNAKNAAIAASRGRLLFFVDGHVAPGDGCMRNAVELYDEWTEENGPGCFHTPLTYHILEDHRLIYKFKPQLEKWFLGYGFTGFPKEWNSIEEFDGRPWPQEVPCGSLCGMLTSQALYDQMGGFPKSLGIYGGGENFWNFTRATLGAKAWVVPGNPLYHYGNKRGYHWIDGDFKKNQAIAAFMYGGQKWLEGFCRKHNKYPRDRAFFERLIPEVAQECEEQRAQIVGQQKMEIEEWIAQHSQST